MFCGGTISKAMQRYIDSLDYKERPEHADKLYGKYVDIVLMNYDEVSGWSAVAYVDVY